MIISRTPLRLSFFGGGTDYREYYERQAGAVLGTTIDKYVYVGLNPFTQCDNYRYRVSYSKTEIVNRLDEIQHPSVRECMKFSSITDGMDIHIMGDLPAKTGLGSSSSFTVGFLNALYGFARKKISSHQLALDAIEVEQNWIKETVGSQDQCHAAYGGLNVIKFTKMGIESRAVEIDEEKKNYLQECLMVFYTGQTRFATDIAAKKVTNIKTGGKDTYLLQMYDMVFEAEKILIEKEKETMLKKFGELLHESWLMKKNLSDGIANDEINNAYERAMRAGAYGGKLAGAGGGGFLIFFVSPKNRAAVQSALHELPLISVQFEAKGSSIIYTKQNNLG